MTTELQLKKAAINLDRALTRRENAIRKAAEEGMSYREIARYLGITHPTVVNILTRNG